MLSPCFQSILMASDDRSRTMSLGPERQDHRKRRRRRRTMPARERPESDMAMNEAERDLLAGGDEDRLSCAHKVPGGVWP